MLSNRIGGALMFRRGVYADVEHDTSFTQTAWLLVVVVAFLNQLGSNAVAGGIMGWLGGAILGTIFAVLGFALGAWVISFIGNSLFNADVTFDEMVRTLGLAYIWNIIGFIGVLAGIMPLLGCILAPVLFIAAILGFVAWLVAAKEALDLEWLQTAITVILGFVVVFIVTAIGGAIAGALGLGAAGLFDAISG